ncbi:hypothetical protein RF11_03882 [Thelohanellus kitauei]|uniref:Uncharacterized protein n=1 Tax=Thelohanellus kitauei TaxID=669202 RepID=A0A0C2IGM3_THEKT|nr:hypothetical protein RF11_03882 [Thelohanellus kitauei]
MEPEWRKYQSLNTDLVTSSSNSAIIVRLSTRPAFIKMADGTELLCKLKQLNQPVQEQNFIDGFKQDSTFIREIISDLKRRNKMKGTDGFPRVKKRKLMTKGFVSPVVKKTSGVGENSLEIDILSAKFILKCHNGNQRPPIQGAGKKENAKKIKLLHALNKVRDMTQFIFGKIGIWEKLSAILDETTISEIHDKFGMNNKIDLG